MAASTAIPKTRFETTKAEAARLAEKVAASDAAFESALVALANPLQAASSFSTPLLQACEVVAVAAGITLKHPERGEAQTIERIAQASGARVRRVQLRGAWWEHDAGPLLSYRDGRPVALLPIQSGGYHVVDPGSAVRDVVDQQIATGIDRTAYIFYGSLAADRGGLAALAVEALRGSYPDLIRVLAASGAAGVLGLATPLMISWLAGSVIPAGDRSQLFTMVGGLVVAAVCSALFNLSAALGLQRISTRASGRTMAAIWSRVLTLPVWFFRRSNPADLALRALSVDRAREALAGVFLTGIVSCVFSMLHVVLLARFAPSLTAPALALVGAIAAVSAVCGRLVLVRRTRIAECEARTTGRTLDFVQGIAKLRLAGAERHAFASWAHAFAQGRRESIRARYISIVVAALQSAAPLAGWTLIVAMATGDPALRARPALLLAFSASFQQLLAGALQLSGFFQTWAQIGALLSRAKPLLECAPEPNGSGIDPGPLRGGLEVRDLTFRYEASGTDVLRGISFRIEPGEFVAFAGSSGSGKSTLLRLLLGFELPSGGTVSYDGRDLAGLDLQAVRKQFGVVLQNGRLLEGDLASNILGATGLDIDAAWRAAKLAGIADEIHAMPMRMHTQLTENGSGLSGGQRQRVLLARALVQQPRILLLDEATSALDNRTQASIAAGLERLGATRIVIAHRLSTIRHADRIFVLEAGRIVESGTYSELWARGGRFRELAQLNLL